MNAPVVGLHIIDGPLEEYPLSAPLNGTNHGKRFLSLHKKHRDCQCCTRRNGQAKVRTFGANAGLAMPVTA